MIESTLDPLYSTLTCPRCGHKAREPMPSNACQWFYTCKGCNERLQPKPADCCVFCSYGDTVCPPRRGEEDGKKQ